MFYGSQCVLDRVSLRADAGQFVALLGASGCGKTTLLRAICGFVALRSGEVAIGGRDITHLAPDKRNVAMVFQSYALWPHMTVAQNIGYGLKLRGAGRGEIAARVDALLAMLRLDGLGDRKVTALSGGQRQRVALGRALAINPQVLLLDEPLSNLDARIREEVRHEIKTLQQDLGITTVHVTHDRQEAMVMADKIVILDAGRVAQVGAPEEIHNHPNSPFVASFIGVGNVVRLRASRRGTLIAIAPEEFSAGGEIDAARLSADDLEALGDATPVAVHFRNEDARLCPPDAAPPAGLVLRGRITQRSYPGGFYRYVVRVGDRQYLVDDPGKFPVGEAIGIALPDAALHLFTVTKSP